MPPPDLKVLALAADKVVEEVAQHLRYASPEFFHHEGILDALAQVSKHAEQQSRLVWGWDGIGWGGARWGGWCGVRTRCRTLTWLGGGGVEKALLVLLVSNH